MTFTDTRLLTESVIYVRTDKNVLFDNDEPISLLP